MSTLSEDKLLFSNGKVRFVPSGSSVISGTDQPAAIKARAILTCSTNVVSQNYYYSEASDSYYESGSATYWLMGLSDFIMCGYYTSTSYYSRSGSDGKTETVVSASVVKPKITYAEISSSLGLALEEMKPVKYVPIPVESGFTANQIGDATVEAVNSKFVGFISASNSSTGSTVTLHDSIGGTSIFSGSSNAPLLVSDSSKLGHYTSSVITGSGTAGYRGFEGYADPSESVMTLQLDASDRASAEFSSSGGGLFYVSSSGKIGIGTSNPTKDLDIRGEIKTVKRTTSTGSIIAISYDREGNKAVVGDNMGGVQFNDENTAGNPGATAAIFSVCKAASSDGTAGDIEILTTPTGSLASPPRVSVTITTEGDLELNQSGSIKHATIRGGTF